MYAEHFWYVISFNLQVLTINIQYLLLLLLSLAYGKWRLR
jgi:hypothetical protein